MRKSIIHDNVYVLAFISLPIMCMFLSWSYSHKKNMHNISDDHAAIGTHCLGCPQLKGPAHNSHVSQKVHKESIVTKWESLRLSGLWPYQKLSVNDLNGGINLRQARRYEEIISERFNNQRTITICESGFFRGGSTLFWLLLFPNATVFSFDVNFPVLAVDWFNDMFPGRLSVFQGDSKITISQALHENSCDMVSVDGDHGPGGSYNDIMSFSKVSKTGALILSDDTFDCTLTSESCSECSECPCDGAKPFCNYCSDGFHKAVQEKILHWEGCDRFGMSVDKKYPIGSCFGSFL